MRSGNNRPSLSTLEREVFLTFPVLIHPTKDEKESETCNGHTCSKQYINYYISTENIRDNFDKTLTESPFWVGTLPYVSQYTEELEPILAATDTRGFTFIVDECAMAVEVLALLPERIMSYRASHVHYLIFTMYVIAPEQINPSGEP